MKQILIILLLLLPILVIAAPPGSLTFDGCLWTEDLKEYIGCPAFAWTYDFNDIWSLNLNYSFQVGFDLTLWERIGSVAINYEYKDYTFYLMYYSQSTVITPTLNYEPRGPAIGIVKKIW